MGRSAAEGCVFPIKSLPIKSTKRGGSMDRKQVVDIANFLSDSITQDQALQLMDEIRSMGIDDKLYIADYLAGGPLYTLIMEHFAEIGEPY